MDGLYISGLDGNNYAINHAVARYMKYMRKERRLELNPKPLYDMRDKTIIMSHNVRTFPKYREDTSEDHDVGNVNILHLTETRISRQETNTRIGGLIEIMRSPVTYDTKSRPIHGSIILISSSVQARPLYQLHSEDVAINAIRLTANRFNFIRVYFSLKAGESNIVPALKKVSESIDFSITTIIRVTLTWIPEGMFICHADSGPNARRRLFPR